MTNWHENVTGLILTFSAKSLFVIPIRLISAAKLLNILFSPLLFNLIVNLLTNVKQD